MCASTPAMRMGIADLGKIEVGASAHLVGLSDDLTPLLTLLGDELEIYG